VRMKGGVEGFGKVLRGFFVNLGHSKGVLFLFCDIMNRGLVTMGGTELTTNQPVSSLYTSVVGKRKSQ